ncbi:IclR family transcriptional regulator [Zhihengliuella flava]|uniref:DNA-binding IclR family transcriptional regulator n=1 Tax=Zhihengliuella flava TaxID=1285193 RepID=A0A931D7P9_9MICC|nr:helix-turn-helix domain-containing protein [Zhihengliuella flava]MBG6083607.1 DNA-binding IclR family transcriptional regulator [Zhihengliuella flava]
MTIEQNAGESAGSKPASQTLSRGIRMLEILAESGAPMTIADLAGALGVHRSIAYRILRTLETHLLVMRDGSGRVQLAPGLVTLARGVQRDLQSASVPELAEVAEEFGVCSFVAVWDQRDCFTLANVEPRHGDAAVIQRPGSRHAFNRGAPGIAIQSALSAAEWSERMPEEPYRDASHEAARLGYGVSHDEVIPGVSAVAAPIRVPHQLPAAVAVVFATATPPAPVDDLGARMVRAAEAIERALGAAPAHSR